MNRAEKWLQEEKGMSVIQFLGQQFRDDQFIADAEKFTGEVFESYDEACAYWDGFTDSMIREFESETGAKWDL